jgi:hypothetical protein
MTGLSNSMRWRAAQGTLVGVQEVRCGMGAKYSFSGKRIDMWLLEGVIR